MIKATIAFKKAIAAINFKKAIAKIEFGKFIIFKFFTDAIGTTDSEVKSFNKSLSDSQGATDTEVLHLGKVVSDTSASTDTARLSVSKILSDTGSVSDEPAFGFAKFATDSSNVTQNQTMDFNKFINEVFAATDDLDGEATAEDDQEMTFVKVRSDLATFTESVVNGLGKPLSDTIGTSDSGSIRSQGYCAFDYFLEDYVGASQTF